MVRLLGVEQFFEGITYCDYEEAETKGRLLAKPERGMWEKAMREAGVEEVEDCYFVGLSFPALSVPTSTYLLHTILFLHASPSLSVFLFKNCQSRIS